MTFIFPRSHLAGLTLSTAGSSATFAVAAGQCADSTNAAIANLATSISKTTSAWATGTGNGALDTGSIANSTSYHAHLICDALGQTVDVLVSLSATAPTLPSGFVLFRRIGWIKTDSSGNWLAFVQTGDWFAWVPGRQDANGLSVSATAQNVTVSTPPGVKCLLVGNAAMNAAGQAAILSDPDISALAVGSGDINVSSTGGQIQVLTNTSSQVRIVANGAATFYLLTYGWFDRRGKDQ